MQLYNKTSGEISSLVTKSYSNSFYLSTLMLDKKTREAIHGVYGFVRLADEIVDTFHHKPQQMLLEKFESDLHQALRDGISLNPILHAFQRAVIEYAIPYEYIDAFLKSMKMDLEKKEYLSAAETETYIYGSANVVGLMCLKIFCFNNADLFNKLVLPAEKLGSAFQKVNFLRDLKADTELLERKYFSSFDPSNFDDRAKNILIEDIETEFRIALDGLKKLPGRSKLAVLTAYYYYMSLLRKIKRTKASKILKQRIRISNSHKLLLMARSYIEFKVNLI